MIWKALIWAILMTLVVSGAKADTYKLALTDTQGTGDTTCDEFTGVKVMFAAGEGVSAPSVHLIRYDPEWENKPPHIRKWFQGLMQPDHPRVSCCGEADA